MSITRLRSAYPEVEDKYHKLAPSNRKILVDMVCFASLEATLIESESEVVGELKQKLIDGEKFGVKSLESLRLLAEKLDDIYLDLYEKGDVDDSSIYFSKSRAAYCLYYASIESEQLDSLYEGLMSLGEKPAILSKIHSLE